MSSDSKSVVLNEADILNFYAALKMLEAEIVLFN